MNKGIIGVNKITQMITFSLIVGFFLRWLKDKPVRNWIKEKFTFKKKDS
jgi:hypothetical protein